MKGHRPYLFVAVAVGLAASFATGFELRSRSLATPPPQPRLADDAAQRGRGDPPAHYYAPLSARVLGAQTLPGMLHRLDDPYTRYLSPGDYRLLKDAESGAYAGIGVDRAASPRRPPRHGVDPAPARRASAGLRAGDLITTIDGTSLAACPTAAPST